MEFHEGRPEAFTDFLDTIGRFYQKGPTLNFGTKECYSKTNLRALFSVPLP